MRRWFLFCWISWEIRLLWLNSRLFVFIIYFFNDDARDFMLWIFIWFGLLLLFHWSFKNFFFIIRILLVVLSLWNEFLNTLRYFHTQLYFANNIERKKKIFLNRATCACRLISVYLIYVFFHKDRNQSYRPLIFRLSNNDF